MNQLIRYLVVVGCASLFLFSPPLLELLGWKYVSSGASAVTKIHPSTYVIGVACLLALTTMQPRYLAVFKTYWYPPFLAATTILTARAITIASGGTVGGGELATAIVTFVTPVMLLICFRFERSYLELGGVALRVFFAINSMMALGERAAGHRFIPSVLDNFSNEHRAAALFGHPLSGALLTGLLVVNLVIAPKRSLSVWVRFAEIGLHVMAMFAFGGRSGLLFLPFALSASAVFSRSTAGDRVSVWQRLAPVLIALTGIMLIMLPIPFVEATIQRFVDDDGSAGTRYAAFQILGALDTHSLLFGADIYRRQTLQAFYGTPYGIELCWLGLTATYGLIVSLIMVVALPVMFLGYSAALDRSARYMILYFFIVTAGSAGFSSKVTLISNFVVMLAMLCQPRLQPAAPGRRGQVRQIPRSTASDKLLLGPTRKLLTRGKLAR